MGGATVADAGAVVTGGTLGVKDCCGGSDMTEAPPWLKLFDWGFGGSDELAKDSLRDSGKSNVSSRYGMFSRYSRSFFYRVFDIF